MQTRSGLPWTRCSRMSDRRLRLVVGVLAAIGVAVAGYLTYARFTHTAIACATGGCETVQSSRYAEVAGIPVALLGLGAYRAILATAFSTSELARAGGGGNRSRRSRVQYLPGLRPGRAHRGVVPVVPRERRRDGPARDRDRPAARCRPNHRSASIRARSSVESTPIGRSPLTTTRWVTRMLGHQLGGAAQGLPHPDRDGRSRGDLPGGRLLVLFMRHGRDEVEVGDDAPGSRAVLLSRVHDDAVDPMPDHHLGDLRKRRLGITSHNAAVHRVRDGQAVSRGVHRTLLSSFASSVR